MLKTVHHFVVYKSNDGDGYVVTALDVQGDGEYMTVHKWPLTDEGYRGATDFAENGNRYPQREILVGPTYWVEYTINGRAS